MKELTYQGLTALLYASQSALKREPMKVTYLLCFSREGAERNGARLSSAGPVICIYDPSCDDLSPYPAESLRGGDEVWQGKGQKILDRLEDAAAYCEENWHLAPAFRFLAGYSLAGLLAMHGAFTLTSFCGFAAVSGSLWFDGWIEMAKEKLTKITDRRSLIYMSIGRKEKMFGPEKMRRGEMCMETLRDLLKTEDEDYPVLLEINPGTHFTDPEGRILKAITWFSENVKSIAK